MPPTPQAGNPLLITALALSLALHAVVLLFPRPVEKAEQRPAQTLRATLAPRAAPAPAPPAAEAPPPAGAAARPTPPKKLTIDNTRSRTRTPRPSTAQNQEMERFLRELGKGATPPPDRRQRALAMAREIGREQARQGSGERDIVELRPNAPPIERLSLDMYLDGVVRKLNRSAAFVKNDPRVRGARVATVLVRLSPDGSLQTFKVLNAADQQAEIAFVRSVVERAVPFSAFPSDLRQSALSLGMIICVMPANFGGGGGFVRTGDGDGC